MSIMEIVGKITALPVRVVDLPFKCMRKLVDDDSEKGVFEEIADVVEESIGELGE